MVGEVRGEASLTPCPCWSKSPHSSKRLRHQYWYKAHDYAKSLIFGLDSLNDISKMVEAYAHEYVNDVSGKVIALRKDDDVLVIPYSNRFDKKYVKRVRRRFHKLISNTKHIRGRHTFLTLTMDYSKVSNLVEAKVVFSRGVSSLIDRIKKKYGFHSYVKSFEFTKSDIIHAHILFLNIPYIDPNWLSSQLEALNLGRIFKIKEFRGDTESGLNYLFKYITKSLNRFDYLALAWALNLRTFSLSKILSVNLSRHKTNFDKGWVYLGVFSWFYDGYGLFSYNDFLIYAGVWGHS